LNGRLAAREDIQIKVTKLVSHLFGVIENTHHCIIDHASAYYQNVEENVKVSIPIYKQ